MRNYKARFVVSETEDKELAREFLISIAVVTFISLVLSYNLQRGWSKKPFRLSIFFLELKLKSPSERLFSEECTEQEQVKE